MGLYRHAFRSAHSTVWTEKGHRSRLLETEQGLGLLVEKDAIYYPMLVNGLAACVCSTPRLT